MCKSPTNLQELTRFYTEEYRPLYDRFISEGAVAQALHTDIAAGVDHLFCNSASDGSASPEDYARAASHFKRATFDGFKLTYEKHIRLPYELLMDRKYADVHDGSFHGEITKLWNEAFRIACLARSYETLSRNTDYASWNAAFAEWKKILPIADKISEILASDCILRVRKNNRRERLITGLVNFLFAAIGALLGVLFSCLFGK